MAYQAISQHNPSPTPTATPHPPAGTAVSSVVSAPSTQQPQHGNFSQRVGNTPLAWSSSLQSPDANDWDQTSYCTFGSGSYRVTTQPNAPTECFVQKASVPLELTAQKAPLFTRRG